MSVYSNYLRNHRSSDPFLSGTQMDKSQTLSSCSRNLPKAQTAFEYETFEATLNGGSKSVTNKKRAKTSNNQENPSTTIILS